MVGVRRPTPVSHDEMHQFAARLLVDAWLDASARNWQRRAQTFEWARPRPGDFMGRASRDEMAARDRRLSETADACRARARLADATLSELHDAAEAMQRGAA